MASVAFIGPDGTGKTTLARRVERSGLLPFRYLYMGVNIYATNAALPTARLVAFAKRRLRPSPGGRAEGPGEPGTERRRVVPRWLWATLRLGNHLADEWYRQVVSWILQARGFVVLYDRHFAFDFSPEIVDGLPNAPDRTVHHWLVTHVYPRPDLVFHLDAPGDVLFARKGESTVEELERRRRSFARIGERMPNFIRIDATQPADAVYAEVLLHLAQHFGGRQPAAGQSTIQVRMPA